MRGADPSGEARPNPDGQRGKPAVILNYGSAPGELSVCLRSVGLVERADLETVRAGGPPAVIDEAVERLADRPLRVGGAVRLGDAWWCRPSHGRILVLAANAEATRAYALIKGLALRRAHLSVQHEPSRDAIFSLVGKRTCTLLERLGVCAPGVDLRDVAPCTVGSLGSVEATWLIESDVRALVAVPGPWRRTAQRVLEDEGRPLGLGLVGHEAFRHFSLVERRQRSAAPPMPAPIR